MDLLSKLKKIFKKTKETSGNENTGITVTTGPLRKYSELNRRERKKVAYGIENIPLSQLYILNYTNAEYDKIMYLCDLISNLFSVHKAQREKISADDVFEEAAHKINHLILSTGEYEIIKDELAEIKRKLEIKFYILSGIVDEFNSGKLNRNKARKNEFITAKEIILDKINAIRENIICINIYTLMINNHISESSDLLKACIGHNLCNCALDTTDELRIAISKDLAQEVLRRNNFYSSQERMALAVKTTILNKIDKFHNKFGNFLLQERILPCCKNKSINFDNPRVRKKVFSELFCVYLYDSLSAWEYLAMELPNNLLKELYKIIAKYKYQDDEDSYKHRNDYQTIIAEIEDIVNKCLSTPTKDWKEKIKTEKHHYRSRISGYSELCRDYLTNNIKEELKYAFIKLCVLCNESYYDFKTEYLFSYNPNDISRDEYNKYYEKIYNEFIKKLAAEAGIPACKLYFCHINYLYTIIDALCGCDDININADLNDFQKFYRVYDISQIYYEYGNEGKANISIEDLFYWHKAHPEGKFQNSIGAARFCCHRDGYRISGSEINDLALIKWKRLENQYDDRILISPRIYIDDEELDEDHYITDDYGQRLMAPGNNFIAALARDFDMLYDLAHDSNCRKQIKYIFMRRYPYDDREDCVSDEGFAFYCKLHENNSDFINYNGLKIIFIPEDTTYSELSDILNQELTKTEEAKRYMYTEQ